MDFEVFKELVTAEFPEITPEQLDRFARMEELYRDWNSRINVISRKDIDGFYEHHVLHSLAIASYWRRQGIPGLGPATLSVPQPAPAAEFPSAVVQPAPAAGFPSAVVQPAPAAEFPSAVVKPARAAGSRPTVLDVGTGGGFPGIPLAVLYPEIGFTLCDSVGKKTTVARAVAEALGLANVTVVNARAEALPGAFDFVVSRAVTTLENFYPWVRGRFRRSIFYLKGGDINEEISNLMRRNRLKKGSVRTWRVDNWLKGEYFQEKFVIQIEKDYLCSPIVE